MKNVWIIKIGILICVMGITAWLIGKWWHNLGFG